MSQRSKGTGQPDDTVSFELVDLILVKLSTFQYISMVTEAV